MKKVIKKDGSVENFDKEKIARVVTAAGLTPRKAKALATKVEKYITGLQGNKVTSKQIRNKVVDELTRADKYAAGLYTWYEKTKKDIPQ
jgi:transcriptional regulator NrdR family protein